MVWKDWVQVAILGATLAFLLFVYLQEDIEAALRRLKRRARCAALTGPPAPDGPAPTTDGPTPEASAAPPQDRVSWLILRAYWGNKILSLLLLIPFGLTYGWFMASTGLPRYFWSDAIFEQAIGGFSVTLMIVGIMYTMFCTDTELKARWVRWSDSLERFHKAEHIHFLASLLLICFPLLVAVLMPAFLPLFRGRVESGSYALILGFVSWPWLLGAIAGYGMFFFLLAFVIAIILNVTFHWGKEPWPNRFNPGRTLRGGTYTIAFAVGWLLLFLLMPATKWLFGFAGLDVKAPIPFLLALAMMLGLVVYIALVNRGWVWPAFLGGLVVWVILANSGAYKLTVPRLNTYYPPRTLMHRLGRETTYGALGPRKLDDLERRPAWAGLSNSAVLDRWRAGLGESGDRQRPKLVVVAASGGGLRAALWTATVLRELERRFPEFPHHLRLITGASGGMLGAAYYTTRLRPTVGASHHDRTVNDLASGDFLAPVVERLLLHDVPSIFLPWRQAWDRGQELEAAWRRATDKSLDRTFADLRPREEQGAIPSLVISPMLAEDGRRLLISNLDLDGFTGSRGPSIEGTKDGHAQGDSPYSLSAIEFFRLFPEAHTTFQVGTAVRLNATFPYVSPAVSLPTDPPRRVLDAGYYDNYGVNLAANWIDRHAGWLAENTSGVVLIQIRPFSNEVGLRDLKRNVVEAQTRDQESTLGSLLAIPSRAIQFFTSPLDGLSASRPAIAYYRNDEQLALLAERFRRQTGHRDFFQTVVFTCGDSKPGSRDSDSSETLSWAIGRSEADRVMAGMNMEHNRLRRNALVEWWGIEHGPGRAAASAPADQGPGS